MQLMEVAGSPGGPDWVARWTAVAGLLLTFVLFLWTRRGEVWRGRARSIQELRHPLRELRDVISATEQDAANASQLWTVTAVAHLQQLREIAEDVPDRRLRVFLTKFDTKVRIAKGDCQPSIEPDGGTPPLSANQHEGVKAAAIIGQDIEKRASKIRRKGYPGS